MSNYKKISSNIQQLTISNPRVPGKIKWLNISNPGKEELSFLRKIRIYNFDFAQLRASSAKVTAERPMIEQREKYFFLILQFPVFQKNEIVPAEVDFFISHGLMVTLHSSNLPALNDFFNLCKKDDSSLLVRGLPSSAILLYELLSKLILYCYDLIDQNSAKINEMEKTIFSHQQKKAVEKILELKRNIINIRRIILNHKNILKKIMEMKSKVISTTKLNHYYLGLIEQTKRIWEFTESQKETIDALNATNESLLNYSINDIIKTLTIFSVIILPLSFLASIFGMNTIDGMPFLSNPNGFWIVLSLMGIGGLGMILFFVRKKWL